MNPEPCPLSEVLRGWMLSPRTGTLLMQNMLETGHPLECDDCKRAIDDIREQLKPIVAAIKEWAEKLAAIGVLTG